MQKALQERSIKRLRLLAIRLTAIRVVYKWLSFYQVTKHFIIHKHQFTDTQCMS